MRVILLSLLLLLNTDVHAVSKKKASLTYPSGQLKDWRTSSVLCPTERKAARTAILIIAPPVFHNCFIERRWALGRKVWEQYMNANENVDCFFIQPALMRPDTDEQVWLEENTIYVGDPTYKVQFGDRLLHKTIKALEWLGYEYTHYIRTNVNTFMDLDAVNDYMETHHTSMYTAPLWQTTWYAIGYGVVFSADVAEHMVKEYNRLEAEENELISPYHSDDAALASLATGVWPYNDNHPFSCCPTLPFGVRQLMCRDSFSTPRFSKYGLLLTPVNSANEAIDFANRAANTVMLYRTRDGLNLEQLTKFYNHMLKKIYPQITTSDLSEYVKSLEALPPSYEFPF